MSDLVLRTALRTLAAEPTPAALASVVAELRRGRAGEACGIEWGVCPSCLGTALRCSTSHLRCAVCSAVWTTAEREPCSSRVAAIVRDAQGGAALMCWSHADATQNAPRMLARVDLLPETRDPRVDPRAGDMVRLDRDRVAHAQPWRTVVVMSVRGGVELDERAFPPKHLGEPPRGFAPLAEWRELAAGGQVLHLAQPGVP